MDTLPWFLSDPERFRLERNAIEELSRSTEWLVGYEWNLEAGLCLDAVIRAHGHDYEVRVSFPGLYPDAPSVVRPRNMQWRLSAHQYGGADGPLCLEWGPDNWHRGITAAQMIESAYRLLHFENPLGENRPEIPVSAPSRHKLTFGQELRDQWARWYESKALSDYLAGQPGLSVGSFKYSLRCTSESFITLIHEAMTLEGITWRDDHIPTTLGGGGAKDLLTGIWFKTELDGGSIGRPATLSDLKDLLACMDGPKYLAAGGASPVDGFRPSMAAVLIVDRMLESHVFMWFSDEEVFKCSRIRSEALPVSCRSPVTDVLCDKSIGMVGAGSVGSKIAVSLARMGIRKFYLVDHDIMLPENVQRHALDWQSVLQHKVDALKAAILLIAPGAQVEVSRLNLTGQESNAAIAGALSRLAACDALVDASANPRVFNLLSAVAVMAGRPMIWMEVFGGGKGGLIARSRPGTDPIPLDMRNAYLQFCTENPAPSLKRVPGNYAAETEEGEVMVASDAEIAVIAHSAARLVQDCLSPSERSEFPHSMYLMGLAKSWIFEAPFDTIPISMESFSPAGWHKGDGKEPTPEDQQFLVELIKKRNAADTTQ